MNPFPNKSTNAVSWRKSALAFTLATILAGGADTLYDQNAEQAQMMGGGMHHGMGQGMGFVPHHGTDGTGHDEVNMPGLRGLDATEEESAELATMFRNFPKIEREVTNLPNGIRTLTYSKDEELMAVIASHVTGMITRVQEGRDPKVFIQSPTLDILFERRERIETGIEMTDEGIVVTQTSDDPEVVAALHTHAGEVSDMAARGMQAVHEMMMERAGN